MWNVMAVLIFFVFFQPRKITGAALDVARRKSQLIPRMEAGEKTASPHRPLSVCLSVCHPISLPFTGLQCVARSA